jgi:hypothetical protein
MKLFCHESFPVLFGYTCDCCGRTDTKDDGFGGMEMQEYLHYSDTAGYGSDYQMTNEKYGDGDQISVSLCQYCKFKLLGQYMKVVECHI